MAEQVWRQRRVPGNRGMRYPADPPTVEEIVAVMRQAGAGRSAARMRALIVVLWRAGLRINEALMLNESDLDPVLGRSLCGSARAVDGARSEWMRGPGSRSAHGGASPSAAGRAALLHGAGNRSAPAVTRKKL